jgi:hypothetical protein
MAEGGGPQHFLFFHSRASPHQCTNTIKSLIQEDGTKCDKLHEIKGMVEGFYANLFTSKPCDATDVVLESVCSKVSAEMNDDLCKPYTNEEIKDAQFQMGPTKAPGLDSFPALFYQTHWSFF